MVNLRGHTVYLDANTVIYALEVPSFRNLIAGLLKPLDDGDLLAVTSELTLAETIIGPRRAGNNAAEQLFRTFLKPTASLRLEPVTLAVLEKVIDLRSEYTLKIPDAVHLSTGILAKCDLFITADQAWGKTGVTVIDPAEVG